ncbi:hypothetical protein COLO4_20428 [Corchorus olitorius]|uniref:Uncharacterized protein n=1 Tax=Corchorus olitorius TaxID=93759 RepID=A0A1R3IZY1_9ROSI|nr:hypothetical protein COLO4_20428 [Corchorus olitorius]
MAVAYWNVDEGEIFLCDYVDSSILVATVTLEAPRTSKVGRVYLAKRKEEIWSSTIVPHSRIPELNAPILYGAGFLVAGGKSPVDRAYPRGSKRRMRGRYWSDMVLPMGLG